MEVRTTEYIAPSSVATTSSWIAACPRTTSSPAFQRGLPGDLIWTRSRKALEGERQAFLVADGPEGSHGWKTADAAIGKSNRRLAELEPPRVPAKATVQGRIDEPLAVRIIDVSSGKVSEASSAELGVLEAAEGAGLASPRLSSLRGLDLGEFEGGSWCRLSWVKDTRRRAMNDLKGNFARIDSSNIHMSLHGSTDDSVSIVDKLLDQIMSSQRDTQVTAPRTKISALTRSYEQVDAMCGMIEDAGVEIQHNCRLLGNRRHSCRRLACKRPVVAWYTCGRRESPGHQAGRGGVLVHAAEDGARRHPREQSLTIESSGAEDSAEVMSPKLLEISASMPRMLSQPLRCFNRP